MPEIRNPNLDSHGSGSGGGGGGDFRSLITFTFVALALLLAFQYFKPQSSTPAPAAQSAQQAASTAAPASGQASGGAATTPSASGKKSSGGGASAKPAIKPTAGPAIVASTETETTVENELYRITFTNRGAQVKHWILKKYKDSAGKPLDLVQPQLAKEFGLPLSLFTYDSALTQELNTALYQPSATGELLAPGTLTFHYQQNGLDVAKTFHFSSSYVIGIQTEVQRNGAPVRALVRWPAALGDMEEFLPSSSTRSQMLTPSQIVWSMDGKQKTIEAKKVSGDATYTAPYDYAAVTDLYFAAAFLPSSLDHATVVTLHNSVDLPSDLSNPTSKKKPDSVLGLAVGDTSGITRLRLFAGPKGTDVLTAVHATGEDGKPDGPSLEPLIQYGWWTIIAKPLYWALRWLNGMMGSGVNSWGWAILVFTLIFTIALLPTRFLMMKSSLKMMRIQPKVEAIKKRYANLKMNDPKRQEMNAEMMALYKEEGVNMYGSCLPLLLQMPLFFAFYKVLENAVELRHAHWLWLADLSSPDPTHILPILIIMTMFLTQYITPSPGMDPAQRRMMAIAMPVVFGFMLWHYASGLALYWGSSNLINLAMQLGVNQSHIGKEMHELAARKAAKKLTGKGGPTNARVIQGRR
ncbi:MAG TPA: membrane protein insertase YidC [Terracidiphilus sp.]|nr:membrane protein insertase YidC [Terracidiphilus sp.]